MTSPSDRRLLKNKVMPPSSDKEPPEDKKAMSPPLDRESQGTEAMFASSDRSLSPGRQGHVSSISLGASRGHNPCLWPPQQFPE